MLGAVGQATASLDRPSYASGDRWVYVLEGSLDSLPGVNRSSLLLTLVGRVEVAVAGSAEVVSGGATARALQVTMRTSGFLNGTFRLPRGTSPAPVVLSGSLTSEASELWEDQGFFPVEARGASVYAADLSYIFTTPFRVATTFNATTSVVQGAPFPLEVGQATSATLRTTLDFNATVTALRQTERAQNRTSATVAWKRTVVSLDPVAVDAGTFTAYRLDQGPSSLLDIVGVPSPAAGNETSYFSNEVGYYVKRDVYVNGTRIAEMRLKSYSRGPANAPSVPLAAVVGLGVAAAVAPGAWYFLRRQRRATASRGPDEPTGGDHGRGSGGGSR